MSQESNPKAMALRQKLAPFHEQLSRVVVGQRQLIDRLVIALITGGHVLIEGMPGLAKTLTVRTTAQALGLSFARVQFTPDLLPADVIGTQVFRPQTSDFAVKKGPIFANLVLADEINRAPAKVQSALLEAMQELQVTIGEASLPLPRPFLVLATQNPIEHEGTYPLPEAQLDRFLFKVAVNYPSKQEESELVTRLATTGEAPSASPVLSANDLDELRRAADAVYTDAKVTQYAIDLVRATRNPSDYGLDLGPLLQFGASPRASLGLIRAAKAHAMLDGRDYIVPHDVKSLAPDVLRHRLILSFEAEADGMDADAVLARLLAAIPLP